MTWPDALNVVVARTRHERYRDLCSDSHPDREKWRALMVRKATNQPEPPTARPADPPAWTPCCGGIPLPP